MLQFSIGVNGISKLQADTPDWFRSLANFESKLGGGKETVCWCFLSFIWARRSKMIYYFVMFGLDKLYVSYMKLALA